MSIKASTRVGKTPDILAHIGAASDLSPRDLFSCLLTCSTFFHTFAPALYHTLPISHACNPLKGASKLLKDAAKKISGPPYGKDNLLRLVKKVYLEYTCFAPGHTQDYWDVDCPCYPLPNLHSIIVQVFPKDPLFSQSSPPSMAFVQRLCAKATKLFMGPHAYSTSTLGDATVFIPTLLNLRSVCLSIPFAEAASAVELLQNYMPWQSAFAFTELHLYLWDDITPLDDPLLTNDFEGPFGPRHLDAMKERTLNVVRPVSTWEEDITEVMELCGFWSWTKSVSIYNIQSILSRHGVSTGKKHLFADHEAKYISRPIHLGQSRRKSADGSDAVSLPSQTMPITFHEALEMYDKGFWSGVWNEGEGWYYGQVVRPSEEIQKLREEVVQEIGVEPVALLALPEADLIRFLHLWQNPPKARYDLHPPNEAGETMVSDLHLASGDPFDHEFSSDEEASEDEMFLLPWEEGVDWRAQAQKIWREGMDVDYDGYEMEDVDGRYFEELKACKERIAVEEPSMANYLFDSRQPYQ
ncbi:hypothetical protein L198_00056 [Cryptococcus wingfieldii CBS 7118]|uniref:F-box domain-containing protein n=1 Tax=Cryptococcus wingfieldii CBS 7118 TaxID=1295528 RepID=A0A1E3K7X6_9TREE|nr:hypothetical protein L198_00056 [Cryptococcus wingfieldii CBS 7118]ODO08332.1 hypothetical protein L198_00056 [Cryptococcus wingfieldii CBS 7118]